jgi:hypothetical protein
MRRLPASLRTPRYPIVAGGIPPCPVAGSKGAQPLPPGWAPTTDTRPEPVTADNASRCEADPAHHSLCVNAVGQAGLRTTAKVRNGATTTREER